MYIYIYTSIGGIRKRNKFVQQKTVESVETTNHERSANSTLRQFRIMGPHPKNAIT